MARSERIQQQVEAVIASGEVNAAELAAVSQEINDYNQKQFFLFEQDLPTVLEKKLSLPTSNNSILFFNDLTSKVEPPTLPDNIIPSGILPKGTQAYGINKLSTLNVMFLNEAESIFRDLQEQNPVDDIVNSIPAALPSVNFGSLTNLAGYATADVDSFDNPDAVIAAAENVKNQFCNFTPPSVQLPDFGPLSNSFKSLKDSEFKSFNIGNLTKEIFNRAANSLIPDFNRLFEKFYNRLFVCQNKTNAQ